MDHHRGDLAGASRDSLLTLRRVERQQWLIERLHRSHEPVPLPRLAEEIGVSLRTVTRDVERLRDAGVPLVSRRGRDGGVLLLRSRGPGGSVSLDVAELAVLMASLAVLGPESSISAGTAMGKLRSALCGGEGEGARERRGRR